MSVENLRVDEPASKGWANLYMNNLTVYDTITAKRVITTNETEETIIPYKYFGSITPVQFNVYFFENAGLATLQLIERPTFIPANNTAFIKVEPVVPLPTRFKNKNPTGYPIWINVDGKREIGTVNIDSDGSLSIFRSPNSTGNFPQFSAGSEVEFTNETSFTYVRQ